MTVRKRARNGTNNGARWRVLAWHDVAGDRKYTLIQEFMRDGAVFVENRWTFDDVDFNGLFIKMAQAIANPKGDNDHEY